MKNTDYKQKLNSRAAQQSGKRIMLSWSMGPVICSNCNASVVHRSRRRGLREWLVTRIFGRRFVRCEECAYRFLVPKREVAGEKKSGD